MDPHFTRKASFFPLEKFLTSSPEKKIPLTQALWIIHEAIIIFARIFTKMSLDKELVTLHYHLNCQESYFLRRNWIRQFT